jgi:hypothetical protein
LRIDRLEQIVGRMLFESLQGMRFESGDENDLRQRRSLDHADHLQAADARHLDIQEHHVRTQTMDGGKAFDGIGAFPDDLDVAGSGQQGFQFLARGRLVVDQQGGQHAASSSSTGRRMRTRVQQSGSQLTSMP